jgi:hypothetical protein
LDNSVDDRINSLINTYVEDLKSSEHGWMASIGTSEGYYRFWMHFRDSNVVHMQTDNPRYESMYKGTTDTSTYAFRALQRPTLIFATYSYLSLINDPNPSISGSDSRSYKGLSTDFEFEVERYEGGVFYMIGRFNKVKAVFKKASAAEKAGVDAGLMMELPKQIADTLKSYYIKAKHGATEIVTKVYDNRRLYVFWYDSETDKGEEKTGYYNVEVDGSRNLFFPEEVATSSIAVNGLTYEAAQEKYTHFTTTSAGTPAINVEVSYNPPDFPLSKVFGYVGSDRIFDKLSCITSLEGDLSDGEKEAKSSVELMLKFFSASILCLGYEIDCYFTKLPDGNVEWNVALQGVSGIGLDLETGQTLTASFPTATYAFPVTVENNGLTFTTSNEVKMYAGAKLYYEKGVLTQLVDNFKSNTFNIGWSDYKNSGGLALEVASEDEAFVLPVLLSKR